MKNKKLHILIVIALMFLVVHTAPALALKQAIFPDSKSVQPLPKDVYPNISGNVNSTVSNTPSVETKPLNTEEKVSEVEQGSTENNVDDSPSYLLWSIIIFILIVVMFIFYFKSRKSNQII